MYPGLPGTTRRCRRRGRGLAGRAGPPGLLCAAGGWARPSRGDGRGTWEGVLWALISPVLWGAVNSPAALPRSGCVL